MPIRRTILNGLRQQVAQRTESTPIWLLRFNAAGLSIGFGIIGMTLFVPMVRGVMPWATSPGSLVMLVGGFLGIGAQRSSDVTMSQRWGSWAAIATALGLLEVGIVLALST